jgi:hypothetical protein
MGLFDGEKGNRKNNNNKLKSTTSPVHCDNEATLVGKSLFLSFF